MNLTRAQIEGHGIQRPYPRVGLGDFDNRNDGIDRLALYRRADAHFLSLGITAIMSSSMRAPGALKLLIATNVPAGCQSPKCSLRTSYISSMSRISVTYFVIFTTWRQVKPFASSTVLMLANARRVCSFMSCGSTCSSGTCGCL